MMVELVSFAPHATICNGLALKPAPMNEGAIAGTALCRLQHRQRSARLARCPVEHLHAGLAGSHATASMLRPWEGGKDRL